MNLRGIFDDFIYKDACAGQIDLRVGAIVLLAIILERFQLPVLSGIEQVVALLAKSHHGRKASD